MTRPNLLGRKRRDPKPEEIMERALVVTQKYGRLVRVGGVWTYPGCSLDDHGLPVWHIGLATMVAMVSRNVLQYSEWKQSRKGPSPTVAILATGHASMGKQNTE